MSNSCFIRANFILREDEKFSLSEELKIKLNPNSSYTPTIDSGLYINIGSCSLIKNKKVFILATASTSNYIVVENREQKLHTDSGVEKPMPNTEYFFVDAIITHKDNYNDNDKKDTNKRGLYVFNNRIKFTNYTKRDFLFLIKDISNEYNMPASDFEKNIKIQAQAMLDNPNPAASNNISSEDKLINNLLLERKDEALKILTNEIKSNNKIIQSEKNNEVRSQLRDRIIRNEILIDRIYSEP